MGIAIEFNPDLALRKHGTEGRAPEECVPELLIKGKQYLFLKAEQRVYWFGGEIPLLLTEGNGKLSRPIASVKIVEATHFMKEGKTWTRGIYEVIDVFDTSSDKIHFESYARVQGK